MDARIDILSIRSTSFSVSIKLVVSELPPNDSFQIWTFAPSGEGLHGLNLKSDNQGYLVDSQGDRIVPSGMTTSRPIERGKYVIGINRGGFKLNSKLTFKNWKQSENDKTYTDVDIDHPQQTTLELSVDVQSDEAFAKGKLWFKDQPMPFSNGSTSLQGKKILLIGNDTNQETFTDVYSNFSTNLKGSKSQAKCWIKATFEGDDFFDKCESEIVYYDIVTGKSKEAHVEDNLNKEQQQTSTEQKSSSDLGSNLLSNDIPVITDDLNDIDSLGRKSIAFTVAKRLDDIWNDNKTRKKSSAFLINIDGPWGSGKSFLLNLIKKELADRKYDTNKIKDANLPKTKSFLNREISVYQWIVVEFNAWQYQRITPPWWSLINSISVQTASQLSKISKWRSLRFKISELSWRIFSRRSKIFLIVAAIFLILGIITFPSFITSLANEEFLNSINSPISLIISVVTAIIAIKNSLLPGSESAAKDFMKSTQDPLKSIQSHFNNIIQIAALPILILIDDLDRCKEDYVVSFIEGIQTLFKETNVIFIIAADKRWIFASYENVYNKFKDSIHEPGRPLGNLFLDKIFQISFTIPKLSNTYKAKFLRELLRLRPIEDLDSAKIQAEKDAGNMTTKDLLDELDNQKDPVYDIYFREAAIKELEKSESVQYTKHWLENFSHLMEPNPRSMIRLLVIFFITRALIILRMSKIDCNALVLWIILNLRWPELGSYLEKHPENVSMIGNEFQGIPNTLNDLFNNQDVIDVVSGKDTPSRLDEQKIKAIIEA